MVWFLKEIKEAKGCKRKAAHPTPWCSEKAGARPTLLGKVAVILYEAKGGNQARDDSKQSVVAALAVARLAFGTFSLPQ